MLKDDEVKKIIEELKVKFDILKNSIRTCLDKNEILVRNVADALTTLSPDDDDCHKMFLESHIEKIFASNDNFVLFGHMNLHWNYLDPSLLQHLVKKLNLNDVKEPMEKYRLELQQFRMKTPLTVFCKSQKRKRIELSPEFKDMLTEFNWPANVTLEVVEQFRQEYVSHYQLHKCAMMLSNASIGCFVISWIIPESVVEKLKNKENFPINILTKYSVTKLTIAGMCIYHREEVIFSMLL